MRANHNFLKEKKAKELKIIKRKKARFYDEIPMHEVIKRNNKLLANENLTEEKIFDLKKEKLLAVQAMMYRVMEKSHGVFRIPQLIYRRKKILKDKQYADALSKSEEKLTFRAKQSKSENFRKTKIVKKKKIKFF